MSQGARAHVGASLRHLSGQSGGYDPDFVAAYNRQRHIRPYNVVDLDAVSVLELVIWPDLRRPEAVASLASLRLS